MREFVNGVVNVLSYLEVTFAPARKLVVEGIRQRCQLFLRRKVVRDSAHLLGSAVVEEIPHLLSHTNAPKLFAQSNIVSKLLLDLVPRRIFVWLIHWPLRFSMGLRLVHEICDPGGDWLDQYLRSLTFEEVEHVEVAVAFCDLRPEFAGDFYRRFHARAVHFNRVHSFAGICKSIEIVLTPHVLVPFAKYVERIAKNLVALYLRLQPLGRALLDFESFAITQVLA